MNQSSEKSQLQFIKRVRKLFIGQGRHITGQPFGIYDRAPSRYFHRSHKEKIVTSRQYKNLKTCVFYLKIGEGKFYQFTGTHLIDKFAIDIETIMHGLLVLSKNFNNLRGEILKEAQDKKCVPWADMVSFVSTTNNMVTNLGILLDLWGKYLFLILFDRTPGFNAAEHKDKKYENLRSHSYGVETKLLSKNSRGQKWLKPLIDHARKFRPWTKKLRINRNYITHAGMMTPLLWDRQLGKKFNLDFTVCGQTAPYYKKSFVHDTEYSDLILKINAFIEEGIEAVEQICPKT